MTMIEVNDDLTSLKSSFGAWVSYYLDDKEGAFLKNKRPFHYNRTNDAYVCMGEDVHVSVDLTEPFLRCQREETDCIHLMLQMEALKEGLNAIGYDRVFLPSLNGDEETTRPRLDAVLPLSHTAENLSGALVARVQVFSTQILLETLNEDMRSGLGEKIRAGQRFLDNGQRADDGNLSITYAFLDTRLELLKRLLPVAEFNVQILGSQRGISIANTAFEEAMGTLERTENDVRRINGCLIRKAL